MITVFLSDSSHVPVYLFLRMENLMYNFTSALLKIETLVKLISYLPLPTNV